MTTTIAFLSDIHGNHVALRAALDDMQAAAPDRVIFPGDAASDGAQPHQVIETLQALQCDCIRGNMDDFLLKPQPRPADNVYRRRLNEIAQWSAAQLHPAERNFLRGFVDTLALTVNGVRILCYHGSPRSNEELLLATTDEHTLSDYFADTDADIGIGGHTHTPLYRRWNRMTLLNPGSVGLASYRKQARMYPVSVAEYLLLTVQEGGRVSVDFRRVPYDPQPYFAAMRQSGIPHAAWLISLWDV
jgi:putative phosphoesterase